MGQQLKQIEWHEQWKLFRDDELFMFKGDYSCYPDVLFWATNGITAANYDKTVS